MKLHHLQSIDLNLLPWLLALLEEAHITRAALRVGKTQSALSHALRKLRLVFDDELLVRSGNDMLLTPMAQSLLPELQRMLCDMELLIRPQGPIVDANRRRTFQIATTEMTEFVIMRTLQPRLAAIAPGVQLHTSQTEQRGGLTIEQRLRAGEFDLAWMVVFDDAPGIIAQRLYAERLICACRPGHPSLGADGQLTLAHYVEARHALISPRGQPGGFVDDALQAAGLKREITWITSSFLAAPLVASVSDMVLTLPERLARALVASGVALHLCPVPLRLPTFQVSLVYHERFRRDGTHRWLREQTLQALAQETSA